MSEYLFLLRRYKQCPWKPPPLEPEAVAPRCALDNTGFGFTQLEASVSKKACERGEAILFEHLPRRGDDHEIVRVAHETNPCVSSRFPGWALWVALYLFAVAESFHPIEGPVRQEG
jgi:hypothetical protein